MMLMTAVEEDGEAGIDVQVQWMMQSQILETASLSN